MGKNVISFGVDNSASGSIDGKSKNILNLGDGRTQESDNAAITAAAKYPINFTEPVKRYVLRLKYNGSNSFLFINAVKVYRFKGKDSEINPYPLFTGNISKDFTIDNMKKTGLKESVKGFSVDYNPIDTSNILDIHRYLMKET